MTRRTFLCLTAAVTVLAALRIPAAQAAAEHVRVYKTASCGCCTGWIRHLERHGFRVSAQDLPQAALMQKKLKSGLNPEQSSCHTAEIAGYVVEGHVPARELKRLLSERPDAIGLAVPDMPLGSPGMEAGDDRDAYDVLLIRRDGRADVFAHYPEA